MGRIRGGKRPMGRRSKRRSIRDLTEGNFGKCLLSSALFLLILGAAFGIIFGLIPLDQIKDYLGINSESTSDNGSNEGNGGGDGDGSTGGATNSTTTAPTMSPRYSFMQCPLSGDCCNGLQSNCQLKANEILWPSVHNAMHDDLLGNNQASLEEALEAGYRGLLLDVCLCENPDTKDDELVFCHGFCAVGKRTFDEVFTNINTFLDNNPTETLLINFEISVGDPNPQQIWDNMSQYPGISEKTYIHNSKEFPSMKQMQNDGKQLLLFKHNGFDCSNTSLDICSDRILEFHKYTVETEYNFQSESEIENYSQSCVGTRGVGGTKDFYHINHFVTKPWSGPSLDAAKNINQKLSIGSRIAACESVTGFQASIISIDFWQEGDLLEVVQEINKIRAEKRRSLRRKMVDWIQQ